MKKFTLVIIESPYAGDIELNEAYARAAMRDCLYRGEAPYASHLLYTQPGVLDDTNTEERALGIEAGLNWGAKAEKTVVYTDLGVSIGMKHGIVRATIENRPSTDCKNKGRTKSGLKDRPELAARGEMQGGSKLTKEIILQIRESYLSQYELSKVYNISQTQISRVINRKAWKHI